MRVAGETAECGLGAWINKSGWWYVGLQVAPSLLPSIFIFDLISMMALFLFVFYMANEGGDDNVYGPSLIKRES